MHVAASTCGLLVSLVGKREFSTIQPFDNRRLGLDAHGSQQSRALLQAQYCRVQRSMTPRPWCGSAASVLQPPVLHANDSSACPVHGMQKASTLEQTGYRRTLMLTLISKYIHMYVLDFGGCAGICYWEGVWVRKGPSVLTIQALTLDDLFEFARPS